MDSKESTKVYIEWIDESDDGEFLLEEKNLVRLKLQQGREVKRLFGRFSWIWVSKRQNSMMFVC